MSSFRKTYVRVWVGAALFCVCSVWAQTSADYAVQLSATVQTNPAKVTLSWPADSQVTSYTVYRKGRDAAVWGAGTTLPGTAIAYTDSGVAVGGTYEYRVDKAASVSGASMTGEGYLYAGIQAPLVESRGKVVLIVDNTFSSALAFELVQLQQDLVADGWTVLRHNVSRTSSVSSVKALIVADYNADRANVKSVFLFGHVPVPYSGDFAPDGHPEHVGAWPADVYYADMDGVWTDFSVTSTGAQDSRNWNVPGDGKFDQITLPSDVELQIGRVDLSNLPSFSLSETELLRQYLKKDHAFRVKAFQAQPRAMLTDNFGVFGGEAFAGNGFRNFPPFIGATNTSVISAWTWSIAASAQSYLWGYGCGPGDYSSAGGVGTTAQFAGTNSQVVFTMLFGSYFGDWDSQDNFLRAPLATSGSTLSCAWVGRPWWQFHHMALGETIGFSTRLTQNNLNLYAGGFETRGVHVALMGDPTLRAHSVAPPTDLLVFTNAFGGFNLRWTPSADSVVGYHVYRAFSTAGPFSRISSNLLNATSYTDPTLGANVYMVRAVKLETSASGSYFNPSLGVMQSAVSTAIVLNGCRLSLAPNGSTSFVVTGTGLPGRSYQLQAYDGPNGGAWRTIGTVTNDSWGTFRFTNSASVAFGLYRTLAQ